MLRPASAKTKRTLEATLEHAARAPYYAQAWKNVPPQGPVLEILARLPLLDKETAAERQEELHVPGVQAASDFLDAGIVSSATSREGRPLRLLLSADEAMAKMAPAAGRTRANERSLRLYSPRHGVPLPQSHRVLLPATLHPNTVDVLHDLLSSKQGPRFRALVAPLSGLKWLTVALVERGIPPAGYGLKGIGTTGHALTAHARSWLEPLWRAPLFDNYSLSELRGYAHPCRKCGFGHWHGAPTHFELLDPTSGLPARKRIGELVATTLLPAASRMPLIRYRTGDIVEVGSPCPLSGSRGVRMRGRIGQSLLAWSATGTQYLALSRDLQEAAEREPDVALEPHPAEVLGRVPPSDIGVPKAKIDGESRSVLVELRYDPARFSERASELKQRLEKSLFGANTTKNAPKIELLRPGSLDIKRESLKLL